MSGELIYRDFSSMYPPLGIELAGWFYRAFGATFAATNVYVNFLSFAVVVVSWRLARRLVREPLALGTAVALSCAGATNAGNFALFSLGLYTPSILCGLLGLGVALLGALDVVAGRFRWQSKGLIALGTNVALLSKLEHGLAAVVALVVLGLSLRPAVWSGRALTRWAGSQLALGAVSCVPALVVYVAVCHWAGTENVLEALGGYGVAGQFCPLWPTGLGLLGALAALGEAVAVCSVFVLCDREVWRQGSRPLIGALIGAIIVGIAAWSVHLPYGLENLGAAQQGLGKAELLVAYVFALSSILLPVMWTGTVLVVPWGLQFWKQLFSKKSVSPLLTSRLIVLAAALAISSRSLFGHMFGSTTIVHQASYPLWFVLLPVFLSLGVAHVKDLLNRTQARPVVDIRSFILERHTNFVVASILAVMVIPRAVVSVLRETPSTRIDTAAGPVFVKDSVSKAAYAYVMAKTEPGDRILESPLGGGLSFASHRAPATFTMQFRGLRPSERLRRLDSERFRSHPPAAAIVQDNATLGGIYGVCCKCACTFPRLVWRSDRLGCDPAERLEVLDLVRADYSVDARFGRFIAMVPSRPGVQVASGSAPSSLNREDLHRRMSRCSE